MDVGISESSSSCPQSTTQEPTELLVPTNHTKRPHIVFFPSGLGVGQLKLFFRLAAMLASRGCTLTFITMQPQLISDDTTTFFSSHPEIKKLDFEILPVKTSKSTINFDPFILQIDAILRSLLQLGPLLSTLDEPVSSLVSDFILADGLTQILPDLGIHLYILSTTSARFYSTVAYLPVLLSKNPALFKNLPADIAIPGLAPIPKSSIPNSWMDNSPTNYVLTAYLLPNAQSLCKVSGVFLNTFNWFEPETISALNTGKVLSSLPPVFPLGPLVSTEQEKCSQWPWLDDKASESVIYVNFGSREPISRNQIMEIGKGLLISGYSFLWILKDEQRGLFGELFMEGVREKGKIVEEGRVHQEQILGHPAVAVFMNQCEWDSVMDAARFGVPILAWPQHGDQKMNAEAVEKAGLGVWVKEWGWGEERLVNGEEIAEKVRMVMENRNVRVEARNVREEAEKAIKHCGSGKKLMEFIVSSTQKIGSASSNIYTVL
ncbi:PREDICTED: UDP-glycosyltransferase 708C1-like [Ipomoea nil]|uniref:UDP-glycosyltransferase 708C1-like n=1 Tax=Ipomoea nil TaxID=35883 RepID=UPI00090183E8|nr:PREDICTED: UDP-glycosyltransferase 708C1-like [Ipomoea nil]